MQGLSRRRFLYVVGATCWSLSSNAQAQGPDESTSQLNPVVRTARALGSNVTITAYHADPDQAAVAIDRAMAELHLVESLMSIYRLDSELSRLNRTGRLDKAHPYLLEVLQHAQQLAERSEGAFDITVQSLWEAYRRAAQENRLPDAMEIERAQARIGWKHVEIDAKTIRLHSGVQLTLNGIAQGYAADRAAQALARNGVRHALIDTGELSPLGAHPDGRPWTVGIQHPRNSEAYISLAQLAGRCLATSGDYATRFTDDLRHHHLFDPRTGSSPDECASVSIVAKTAMEADALSTCVFVLGIERGMRLLANTPGTDALIVRKDGRLFATRGFPQATSNHSPATPQRPLNG